MPPPLDAERTAAGPLPPQVLKPSRAAPQPRASAEVVPPVAPGTVDVWALVRRAQEGDAEAFGQLYDHYVTLVHRYAYHRVGDRATAEDVTSETFARALRG